jgi:hypothetical protein
VANASDHAARREPNPSAPGNELRGPFWRIRGRNSIFAA